jgi:large subunit ribosomal protein L32
VAVPKRRTSRSKRNMRRANHDKVTAPNLAPCPNCGEPVVAHRACASCGHYKGRAVKRGVTPSEEKT